MRRFAILAGPLLVAAFAFACEDDPSGGHGGSLAFDAGTFDATPPPDGPGVPPDAEGPPEPVTVVVTSILGAPVQGVTVVFHDASGAVLEATKTGADGKAASAPTKALAMATAVFGEGTHTRELLTWTAVQGGDVLPAVAPANDLVAEVDITIPGPFASADAGPTFNYYAKVGRCERYSTIDNEAIRVYLEPYCFSGMGAALVAGSDANDDVIAHALKKPIVLPTDGGLATVATEAWKAPPSDVTVSLTNSAVGGTAYFHQLANETAFRDIATLSSDTKQARFRAPSSFADAYNAAVTFEGGMQLRRTVGKRLAPTSTIALDGAQMPPELTGATLDATAGHRPKVSWTGDMATMKGGVVRAVWFDYRAEETTSWSFVVPPNAGPGGSVTAPALPSSLEDALPLADGGGDTWAPSPEIVFADSDLVPDYAAWKKVQGALLPAWRLGEAEETAILPQSGTFRLTHWSRINQ